MVPAHPEEVVWNYLHQKLQLSAAWCELCGMPCGYLKIEAIAAGVRSEVTCIKQRDLP